jgi:outer membrane protein OmpU
MFHFFSSRSFSSRCFLSALILLMGFSFSAKAHESERDGIPPYNARTSDIRLALTGHFTGYLNYASQDENVGSVQKTDMLRDTEIEFEGATTLNNGSEIAIAVEVDANDGDSFDVGKTYVSYSDPKLGQLNAGVSDGAALLLQVEAPAADSLLDGIDQKINPVNYTVAGFNAPVADRIDDDGIDYDNALTEDDDKLVYVTPVFSGLQMAASYTPQIGIDGRAMNGNSTDNDADEFKNALEIAARYERDLTNTVKMTVGAGVMRADNENPSANREDAKEWNIGADFDIGPIGLGAIYTENNDQGRSANEEKMIVLGADYQITDPLTLGASYYTSDYEGATGRILDTDRVALGAIYDVGSGVSFRGSVQHISHDVGAGFGTNSNVDATSLLLGTHINF